MSPSLILILLNVVASLYAWNNEAIYRKWLMNPYWVKRENQYYRFITSGFIHGDWLHLIFNMIALFSFGRNFEDYLFEHTEHYQLFYYILYFTALIVSEIPTYLKHKNNPGYNSLGASGAVAAILFASIITYPLGSIYIYFIKLPAFIFGAIYLIYSYISSKRNMDGVNHDAHFWGAVLGVLFMVFLFPSSLPEFIAQISQWDLFR
ncbi:MAG TPA: rhomboid family intramembrane serine protease [Cytophagaceae bacterium]|nr:rhomboid family intramembrane serine protease [Cytophagaceae bacterium]